MIFMEVYNILVFDHYLAQCGRHLYPFARPADCDNRATRPGRIVKTDHTPAFLDHGLGDEDTQSEAALAGSPRPGRNIGLTDLGENVRGETGPVIDHTNIDVGPVSSPFHNNAGGREIY